MAQLETRMAAAAAMDSASEWRRWAKAYTNKLAADGDEVRNGAMSRHARTHWHANLVPGKPGTCFAPTLLATGNGPVGVMDECHN